MLTTKEKLAVLLGAYLLVGVLVVATMEGTEPVGIGGVDGSEPREGSGLAAQVDAFRMPLQEVTNAAVSAEHRLKAAEALLLSWIERANEEGADGLLVRSVVAYRAVWSAETAPLIRAVFIEGDATVTLKDVKQLEDLLELHAAIAELLAFSFPE